MSIQDFITKTFGKQLADATPLFKTADETISSLSNKLKSIRPKSLSQKSSDFLKPFGGDVKKAKKFYGTSLAEALSAKGIKKSPEQPKFESSISQGTPSTYKSKAFGFDPNFEEKIFQNLGGLAKGIGGDISQLSKVGKKSGLETFEATKKELKKAASSPLKTLAEPIKGFGKFAIEGAEAFDSIMQSSFGKLNNAIVSSLTGDKRPSRSDKFNKKFFEEAKKSLAPDEQTGVIGSFLNALGEYITPGAIATAPERAIIKKFFTTLPKTAKFIAGNVVNAAISDPLYVSVKRQGEENEKSFLADVRDEFTSSVIGAIAFGGISKSADFIPIFKERLAKAGFNSTTVKNILSKSKKQIDTLFNYYGSLSKKGMFNLFRSKKAKTNEFQFKPEKQIDYEGLTWKEKKELAKTERFAPLGQRVPKKKGREQIEQRIDLHNRIISGQHAKGKVLDDKLYEIIYPEERKAIMDFMDSVGNDLFEDVRLSLREVIPGRTSASGIFNFQNKIITIAKEAIRNNGTPARTMVHELWHSLSRYLPDNKIDVLKKEFDRQRTIYGANNKWFDPLRKISKDSFIIDKKQYESFIKKFPQTKNKFSEGPDGNYIFRFTENDYRFKNIDEFFAEELADRSFKYKFGNEAKTIVAKIKQIFFNVIDKISSFFGGDVSKRIIDKTYQDFLNRTFLKKQRRFGLGGTLSSSFDAKPPDLELKIKNKRIKILTKGLEELDEKIRKANIELNKAYSKEDIALQIVAEKNADELLSQKLETVQRLKDLGVDQGIGELKITKEDLGLAEKPKTQEELRATKQSEITGGVEGDLKNIAEIEVKTTTKDITKEVIESVPDKMRDFIKTLNGSPIDNLIRLSSQFPEKRLGDYFDTSNLKSFETFVQKVKGVPEIEVSLPKTEGEIKLPETTIKKELGDIEKGKRSAVEAIQKKKKKNEEIESFVAKEEERIKREYFENEDLNVPDIEKEAEDILMSGDSAGKITSEFVEKKLGKTAGTISKALFGKDKPIQIGVDRRSFITKGASKLSDITDAAWDKVWEKITNQIPKPIKRIIAGNKSITPEEYKRLAIGRDTIVQNAADDFMRIGKVLFKGVTKEERLLIGKALRGEILIKELPENLIEKATNARTVMDNLGARAVRYGLLDPEIYEKNKGFYLPRMYEMYEGADKELSNFFATNKNPTKLDLKRFMQRKDIPDEIRQAMGEILEPAYLVSKGGFQIYRDVIYQDFFEKISKNENWVTDSEVPGFYKMPDDKKWGTIRRKWVNPDIYRDLMDVSEFVASTKDISKEMKAVYKAHNAFAKGAGYWKKAKILYNTATHFRNLYSNAVLLDLSGMPIHVQAKYIPLALAQLTTNSKWAKAARKVGAIGAEYQANDFKKLNDSFSKFDGKAGTIKKIAFGVDDFVAGTYQLEEQLFKMAKFMHEVSVKGKTPFDAAQEAKKWLFDYSDVPQLVKMAGTYVYPFITFKYKVIPRIVEAAVKRPTKFLKYALLAQVWQELQSIHLEESPEEMKERTDKLPDYATGASFGANATPFTKYLPGGLLNQAMGVEIPNFLTVPVTNNLGEVHYLDLSFIFPWNVDESTTRAKGDRGFASLIKDNLTPNPIFATPLFELSANKNLFTGSEIYDPNDTDTEKAKKAMDYMYKYLMPSLSPEILPKTTGIEGGYGYQKIAKALQNKPYASAGNFSTEGRVRTLMVAILDAIFGLKINPINSELTAQFERSKAKKQFNDYRWDVKSLTNKYSKGIYNEKEFLGELKKVINRNENLRGKIKRFGIELPPIPMFDEWALRELRIMNAKSRLSTGNISQETYNELIK